MSRYEKVVILAAATLGIVWYIFSNWTHGRDLLVFLVFFVSICGIFPALIETSVRWGTTLSKSKVFWALHGIVSLGLLLAYATATSSTRDWLRLLFSAFVCFSIQGVFFVLAGRRLLKSIGDGSDRVADLCQVLYGIVMAFYIYEYYR